MFKNYLKTVFRTIAKNRVLSVINVLGLSIGISACLVIFLIVHFDLSFDDFHPDKERIYRAVMDLDDFSGGKFHISSFPYSSAETIKNSFHGVEKAATFLAYNARVSTPGDDGAVKYFAGETTTENASGIVVTEPELFDIFPREWLVGNKSTALSNPFSVVLTESKARRYFGSVLLADVIGKELVYDDSLRLKVTGIVKDWDRNSDISFGDFISFSTIFTSFLKNTNGFSDITSNNSWSKAPDISQTFIKLAKGETVAAFARQERPLVDKANAFAHLGRSRKLNMSLQPLSDLHFNEAYHDDNFRKAHLPTLYGLMCIAVFILIIAVINFINLSTAQSFQRAREIGIRKVLGTSRKALIFQFLIETFLLCSVSVALSLIISSQVLSLFGNLIPPGLFLNLKDPSLWIFLGILTVVTSLLAGFYPAMVLSGYTPAVSLRGSGIPQINHKSNARKALSAFQFTISLVFIIGTLFVGKQIHFMLHKDMGFSKDAIVTIPTEDGDSTVKKEMLAEKLRRLASVNEVSLDGEPPAVSAHNDAAYLKLVSSRREVLADRRVTGEHYMPLYGLKLLAGKNFSTPINDATSQFLINETCAKIFGFKSPAEALGQLVEVGLLGYSGTNKPTGQIVGVVADFNTRSLYEPVGPTFIMSTKDFSRAVISVKLSTLGKQAGYFRTAMGQLEKDWKEVYPNQPFTFSFYDEYLAGFYSKEEQTGQILTAAMTIAVLISCMGLFGLITFTAKQRTKEIGIRKVLGANVGEIVSMLSEDAVRLILIALVVATPIAFYFTNRWLEGFAFRTAIDWWVFVLAGLGAILIALATICFQAIQAALANPVKSLRAE